MNTLALAPALTWTTLLLGLGGVLAVALRAFGARGSAPARRDRSAVAAARRHSSRVSAAMVVVGGAGLLAWPAVLTTLGALRPGATTLGLVPLSIGLLMIATATIGELTWPRPKGAVRSAPLHRRHVRDVTPAPLLRWLAGLVALLVLVCAIGAATAQPGTNRIERSAHVGASMVTRSATPFVGRALGADLVVAAALVLGATALTLRLVVRRPAVAGVDEDWDLELRRRSSGRLLRAAQLTVGLTSSAVLLVDGDSLAAVGLTVVGRSLACLGVAVAIGVLVVAASGPGPLPAPERAPDAPGGAVGPTTGGAAG